ncbi:Dynamitin [Trinorchestia longiramus]|nr:Dynamitin [Trinorchestia longiramus]
MADPKYAGLPGIVYDQPDVYETSDLPESEQHEFVDVLESSDAVDVLHISAKDAHDKFKDKILDSSRVDFSDRISTKSKTGYRARRIEWDTAGKEEEEDETIVQRYNRLMCEVTKLQEDLLQFQEKGTEDIPFGSSKEGETVSAVHLERQVEELQTQLLGLQLEKQLGSDVVESIANPHLASHKHLTALIDAFAHAKDKALSSGSKKQDTTKGTGKEQGPSDITYQLFYSPEVSKFSQLGPALQLEKRIDRLEKLLGNDQEKMSRLWSWTREGSVLGAVTSLGQRLALLEPAQLDHIEGRLHAVHTKMNVIAEKAEQSPEKETKVQELYELMQKCDVMCCALPEVVDRLVALQGLHNEASQFRRTLQQLDVSQTQLSASVENNEQLLSSVNEKFAENLALINANIASLDARIQALDKSKK